LEYSRDSEEGTREFSTWFRRESDNLLADLRFLMPDVGISPDKLKHARIQARKNLLARPGNSGRTNVSDVELADCVFRTSDPYVCYASSLYILLYNKIKPSSDYTTFYSGCRRLLDHVTDIFKPAHDVAPGASGEPEQPVPAEQLLHSLDKLRNIVSSLSTRAFLRSLGRAETESEDSTRLVRLTEAGIYKRLRTMLSTSSNQLPPHLLNWETKRYDYVGTRVNCLFKNQVFAVYEDAWISGDPFAHWKQVGSSNSQLYDTYVADKPPRPNESDGSRLRWLSIRTNPHNGEKGYYAWQIAALMDPKAIEHRHYNNEYNLRDLRDYLVAAFHRWDSDSALRYVDHANMRHSLLTEYCRWFQKLKHVLLGEEVRDIPPDSIFPYYPLRTPIDILVDVLCNDQGVMIQDTTVLCVNIVDEIIEYLKSSTMDKLDRVYDTAVLLGTASCKSRPALGPQVDFLTIERADLGRNPIADLKCPPEVRNQLEWAAALMKSGSCEQRVWREYLTGVLTSLQSVQKSDLFDETSEDASGSRYEPRSSVNVRDRILAYVLLYYGKPERWDSKLRGKDKERHWTAYDMFYYLMSLVPVEIQVRTSLAHTMAEQYHKIYKSNPDRAQSDTIQIERLTRIGRELDELARQMDDQYEGVVLHQDV
jgi:hypothetical protein